MRRDAFWEAGGIDRPSDHPVAALFARQRIRYLLALACFLQCLPLQVPLVAIFRLALVERRAVS